MMVKEGPASESRRRATISSRYVDDNEEKAESMYVGHDEPTEEKV
jgi:hypothetical protein